MAHAINENRAWRQVSSAPHVLEMMVHLNDFGMGRHRRVRIIRRCQRGIVYLDRLRRLLVEIVVVVVVPCTIGLVSGIAARSVATLGTGVAVIFASSVAVALVRLRHQFDRRCRRGSRQPLSWFV